MDRRRAWLALALMMQVAAAPASAATRLFVSNFGDNTVSVIDTALDREVQTVPVGNSPYGLALRERPPLLAVASSQAMSATLIDPVTLAVLPRTIATAMGPEAVAFSTDGRFLFATSFYEKAVTISDVESGARVGDALAFAGTPKRLLPSRDGTRLFVLLHGDPGTLAVVDLPARAVQTTIPVGPFPSDLVVTPDGSRLLIASFDASSIAVVDLAKLAVIDTLTVDTGYGLIAHPTKPLLYSMVSFDDTVQFFDYATKRPGVAVAVGAWPTFSAITRDGRFLYIVNRDSNNVVKVDTESAEAVLRIATGLNPQAAVLFDPGDGGSVRAGWAAAAILATLGAVAVWRLRRRTASEEGRSPSSPA